MALPQPVLQQLFTEAEFVAFLDSPEARRGDARSWEFVPTGPKTTAGEPLGVIRAMATGTDEHATIIQNIGVAFSNALRDRSCRVYSNGIAVHCPSGRTTVPDVTVVCGPRAYHWVRGQERRDIITNPLAVVEVLSESTEREDRGEKWVAHQELPSLREYVLVDPRRRRVEIYHRPDEASDWRYVLHQAVEDALLLPSIGVTLPLSEVYRDIALEDPPDHVGEDQ